MLTYQRFTAVLLIYGSLFLSGIYYCLRVFWCAAARTSELELEQRTNIKFLVKLGKSGNKISAMLVEVYGDNAMKERAVYKWVKHFSEGRESVTDEERSGRPATSRTGENIAEICQIDPCYKVFLEKLLISQLINNSLILCKPMAHYHVYQNTMLMQSNLYVSSFVWQELVC